MAVNEASLINAAIQADLVSAEQVSNFRQQARRERVKVMDLLQRSCFLPLSAFYHALAELRQIHYVDTAELVIDEEVIAKLALNLLSRRHAIPVTQAGKHYLVMADPDDQVTFDTVRRSCGKDIQLALSDPASIASVLRFYSGEYGVGSSDPIEQFDQIMKEAYIRRASDIHFEPVLQGLKVRMRVDGQMHTYSEFFSPQEAVPLINRIKVLGQLDIAESRMAQDGGFAYQIMDWQVAEMELRMATIPSRFGERATLRVLGQADQSLGLDDLGMPSNILASFRQAISKPYGMILVTGATGSGKSTTLYAALRELDKTSANILTVEDPIEQVVEGITQVQVSSKVNFAQALRSFLRHDPDTILVGEVRDLETAETALKAAMTGHLVLSTLHTNTASSAPSRLTDIGCEPFLVGSSLLGVIAQRLVRRLCPNCKQEQHADTEQARLLDCAVGQSHYSAKGCAVCLGKGYRGRVGLYEALWIDEASAQLIANGVDAMALARQASQLQTLWQDAKAKVLSGLVSLSDVKVLADYEQEAS